MVRVRVSGQGKAEAEAEGYSVAEVLGDAAAVGARWGALVARLGPVPYAAGPRRTAGERAQPGRDMDEIWTRYGRDMDEIWTRYERDKGEMTRDFA